MALALLTYNPKDAAFNVSAPPPDGGAAKNWIGPVGAYGADLFFQIFGFAAFLLPAAILVLGWRWFRSRAIDSQVATLAGYGLLLLSLPALISLLSFIPAIRGAIPAGGFVGALVSSGLLASLNRGAYLVAPALLVVAIFMTTRFSFAGAHAWASGPNGPIGKVEKLGILQKAQARKAGEPKITKGAPNYKLPSPSLLREGERSQKLDEDELKLRARAIEAKCLEFDVQGRVTQINPGPVVTTFEFKPEAGIKYTRITSLTEDLCLALQAESILIERIPGKSTIGIEVPNDKRQTIALREIIEAPEFINSPSKLTLAMGRDLHGRIRVTDLAAMPHLLIAGSTGTGKSVFINSLMMSILYKASPDEVKLVLVDPKRLELNLYENIPHLIAPVVTDPKIASNVLRNATREMENRLKLLAQRGVRNIDQYNRTFKKEHSLSLFDNLEENEHKPLPYLVIVIDELADLMMVDTNNVEESITRLAQMARAVGIHLILATQRPSVDVITGLIKANFPARISFRVASKVDSRTILDSNGSESLLGRGDMLYLPAGSARLHRIHGPLVSEDEIVSVCDFWRQQAQAKYNEQLLEAPKDENGKPEGVGSAEGGAEEADDELYQDAIRVVCEMGRASTSTLQRRLRIGYGRAAHLIDIMEKDGIVGPPDGTRPREVLKGKSWMKEFDDSVQ